MAQATQFRISTLFLVTTVCAFSVWALFSPPQWLGLLALYVCHCLLAAAIIPGIVFHRGYWQAFFIGCAPAVAYSWLGHFFATYPMFEPWPLDLDVFLARIDDIVNEKLKLAMLLTLFGISGGAGVGIRWWALALARKDVKG
jgi:hypothetical protein